MEKNEKIIACAREYLDTPFHHQGRVKGVGVDCAGLIVCVVKETGVREHVNDVQNYPRKAKDGLLQSIVEQHCYKIDPYELIEGDILIFKIRDDQQHLGIVSREDPFYMIHAYSPAKKVAEHIIDTAWWNKFVAAYRVKA